MIFSHTQRPILEELGVKYIDNKRLYVAPNGSSYPSVTTVTGFYKKDAIEKWKERVGEDEANRITTQATVRGSAVHELIENYLNNNPDYKKGHMPVNVETFLSVKTVLDQSLNNIVLQEAPLYSTFLEVGGRVDCIAEWDGKLSIIDFKTSKRRKNHDEIKNYLMQESAYCVMYEERTKVPIKQIVTVMAVDNDEPVVIVDDRDAHIWDFIELRKKFKSEFGF